MKSTIYSKLLLLSGLIIFSTQVINGQIHEERSKVLPEPYLNNEKDIFGSSVSVDGNYAVVGSPGYFGYATVFELREDGKWHNVATLTHSDGTDESYFGNAVSISNDVILIGADGDVKHGRRAGRAFIFVKPAEGWKDMTESAELRPDDAGNFEYFGSSVCIHNDVAVVGKLYGNAYVFQKPASGWTDMFQTAKLSPRPGSSNNYFGSSVSIYNNTIVVGAKEDDERGIESGATYVFEKPAAGWTDMNPTAKLLGSNTDEYDEFGTAVAIFGNTIAIGSPNSEGNYRNSGSVYIFEKAANSWYDRPEHALISSYEAEIWDKFGISVALAENLLYVGAPGVGYRNNKTGAAFVVQKPDQGWESASPEIVQLSPEDLNRDIQYGLSIAANNGRLMVGAKLDDTQGYMGGSVYVYNHADDPINDIVFAEKIFPSYKLNNFHNEFGSAVAIDGLYAVVGSKGYKGATGCAYVYLIQNGEWIRLAQLRASDGDYYELFGCSVDIRGNTIVVGARNARNGLEYQYGAVYLFEMPRDGWKDMTETAKFTARQQKSAQHFGFDIAFSDDVLVVGAYEHDYGEGNYGAAYVYEKPATGWESATETVLLLPGYAPEDCRYFGHSVDVEGDHIVVGAHRNKNNLSGCAYIYEKPELGSWIDVEKKGMLRPANNYGGGEFGFDVSISNDVVLVSAVDEGGGAAYLFERPESGWTDMYSSVRLTSTDNTGAEDFGHKVKLAGDMAIIAAPFNSSEAEGTGAIYFFQKGTGDWTSGTETYKFLASDRQRYDILGYGDVDYSLGNIVAATAYDDDNGIGSGSAYLFIQPDIDPDVHINSLVVNESAHGVKSCLVPSVIDADPANNYVLSLDENMVDNSFFKVVNDSLIAVNGIDFETKSSFTIQLTATNQNDLAITKDFFVEVVDLSPEVSDILFYLDENSPNGLVLNNDYNVGDTSSVTYSITGGNQDNVFSIDASGRIFVEKQSYIDFEKNERFDLQIEASDGLNLSTGNISFTINNLSPILSKHVFGLDENSPKGTFIGDMRLEGDTSSIIIHTMPANTDSIVTIDELNRKLYLNKSNMLDYEVSQDYTFNLVATDGVHQSQNTVELNLNDVAPILVDETHYFDENSSAGVLVQGSYNIGDKNSITYEIKSGNDDNVFAIDSAGTIFLQNQELFDYEVNPKFDLTIEATDGSNLSASTMSIQLNDLEPVLADTTYILQYDVANNYTIDTLKSKGDHSSINFEILSGNTSDAFAIDQHTGRLFVNDAAVIYNSEQGKFELIVNVTDNNNQDSGTIRIEVDNPTGIFEDVHARYNIYPNPTNSGICIDNLTEKSICTIYDLKGNQLITQGGSDGSAHIPAHFLKPGVYIIRIYNDAAVYSEKLVKY